MNCKVLIINELTRQELPMLIKIIGFVLLLIVMCQAITLMKTRKLTTKDKNYANQKLPQTERTN